MVGGWRTFRLLLIGAVMVTAQGVTAQGVTAQGVTAEGVTPQGADWRLSDRSLLYVQVFNDAGRVGSGFAHDHVIRAARWQSELHFDPDEPASCQFSLTVPVRGLAVDEPEMRRRLGYQGDLEPEQREDVRRSMLAEDQLDAEHHPTIEVRAKECEAVRAGRYRANVTMTVRGREVQKVVTLGVTERSPNELHVSGSFPLRHSELGIDPYSAFLGAVANAERMRVVADLLLVRQGAGA